MRTNLLKTGVFFIIAVATFFTACNKSDSGDDAATGIGFISATIDGVSWKSTEMNDILTNKIFIKLAGTIKPESKGISIFIIRDKAVAGTTINFPFVLGADEDVAINTFKNGADGFAIPAESIPIYGSMTFTKVTNTEIEGTFTGTTSDDKPVTNGKFAMVYTKVWD